MNCSEPLSRRESNGYKCLIWNWNLNCEDSNPPHTLQVSLLITGQNIYPRVTCTHQAITHWWFTLLLFFFFFFFSLKLSFKYSGVCCKRVFTYITPMHITEASYFRDLEIHIHTERKEVNNYHGDCQKWEARLMNNGKDAQQAEE